MQSLQGITPRRLTFALLLAAAGLAGCASVTTGTEVSAGTSAAVPAQLGDAEVLGVVATVNNFEIEAARMAWDKATDPEVKRYAEQMIRDHGAANQASLQLATRLGVSPRESALSQQLKATAQTTMSQLSGLSGAAFDQAYINSQIMSHQATIATVDNVLLPSSRHPDLRAVLTASRPRLVAHLQSAQSIKANLR